MRKILTRRTMLKRTLGAGAVLAFAPLATTGTAPAEIRTRPIPSSGEPLPCVGLGTWQQFDVGPSPEARTPLKEVLRRTLQKL